MALSNWDTLAFDKNGKPTNGIFQCKGITAEIYKNWLYIHDPHAWEKDGRFCEDTIMQIYHGEVDYKTIQIIAKRGRQASILCVVYSWDYNKPKAKQYEFMIGCGVYGYRGGKWVGVEEKTFAQLLAFAKQVISEKTPAKDVVKFPEKPLRFNQGDAYFAKAFSQKIPASEVEKAEKPVMEQAIAKVDTEPTPTS